MDGKCHFIVFLLFVHYAISQNCDCKLLDILRNIVQREIMEREMLVSRVEMLESKQGSGTNNGANSSGYSSDTAILERLSVLESMMENFNAKLNEISMERQSGTRLNSALLSAWKIHKHDVSVMNADVQKSIKDNNKRFNQLTLEVDKHKDVIASNVAELINQTNNMVTKQMEDVEKSVEVIRCGLNKTLADYVTKMDKGLAVFLNQTDSTLNGIRAEIKTNECANNPCWNGATCIDGIQSYTCICLAGYSGSQCQIDKDECSSNPCLNGATCVDGINSYSCKCQVGYVYVGGYCQVDECYNNPCMNGATCEKSIGNYSCRCVPGYAGINCQKDIDECYNNPCMNGATCVDGTGNYSCRCVPGYDGINCQKAQDCTAIRKTGFTKSGVYTVSLWKTKNEIQVFCDMSTDNGGWTVFQNRFDGSVDFYQNFAKYENGFGHLSEEFWLGLKYIQEMTSLSQTELRLDLSAADGSTAYEVFRNFRLTEGPGYKLNIDAGTGTAGDVYGLSYNGGSPFTTFDHDADRRTDNCAVLYHGGWWYANCAYTNLNGEYNTPERESMSGITYYDFQGWRSLQTSKMMFRRIA